MSTNNTSHEPKEYAVTALKTHVRQGSVIPTTLPAKEIENKMELPIPIFTPLDVDFNTLMSRGKQPLPNLPTPKIVITPPSETETEKVPLSTIFSAAAIKPRGKKIALPINKRKKVTLPKVAARPMSKEENITTTENLNKPNVIRTKKNISRPISTPSSFQPSGGKTPTITILPNTTSSTRLPVLQHNQDQSQHQDQGIMHTISLDPPSLPHPTSATTTTTTTKPPARWSSYFSPVTTPRPFSLFSTLNYTFQPQSQDLIPTTNIQLTSTSTIPISKSKGRIVTWSSTADTTRRPIELANERSHPNVSNKWNEGRKERGCWENVKGCVGRSVLEFRKRVWNGSGRWSGDRGGNEMDVTAYCIY